MLVILGHESLKLHLYTGEIGLNEYIAHLSDGGHGVADVPAFLPLLLPPQLQGEHADRHGWRRQVVHHRQQLATPTYTTKIIRLRRRD
jgi:hypothetical protein